MSTINPIKPNKVKGTRDFGALELGRREYLLAKIKHVFTKYGFLPLETPAMENLSLLSGNYGNEGDKLLYKILNSGDYLAKVKDEISTYASGKLTPEIAEKGLRYDLTIPFARYVVMNRNDITFPFRRYQIQQVWRADRPQKGRYREFLQCDADIIGTKSLLCEAEIIMMLNEILTELKVDGYEIVMNSRKVLTGLSEFIGEPEKENELCIAIDKLDKIGEEKVYAELAELGFTQDAITKLKPFLNLKGLNQEKIQLLQNSLNNDKTKSGVNDITEVLSLVKNMAGNLETVKFDPTLARGLSYYTGIIFEVRMLDGSIGSISGGGRYDDLTGIFGLPDVSGVGISIGMDRLYDVMEARSLFPDGLTKSTEILIINFGDENIDTALTLISSLRQANIRCELYPDKAKMKKQMTYANKNNIAFVIIAGAQELAENNLTLKNMVTGEQVTIQMDQSTSDIKSILYKN